MRKKFRSRSVIFGGWTSLYHPSITEIFCSIMRPDFLGIDIEHSTINLEQSQKIIMDGQACGVPVLPRVGSHNEEQIRRLMDSGADGVIVPMINTKEEVEKIVGWMKYPPLGDRHFGVSRAQGYGSNFETYAKKWNERSTLLIQIESVVGVENIDILLANEHVDGVMIGPYDISGSLGIPGEIHHREVLKACDRVIAACKKHGKACGTQDTDPSEESVKKNLERGYSFVVLSSDVFLLWKWSSKMQEIIKGLR